MQPSSATLQSRLNQAIALYRKGRLADAEKRCRQICRVAPRNVAALSLMGVLALRRNQPEKADRYFLKALEIAPESADALHNRALTLRKLDRLPEALDCCDRLLAVAPDRAGTLTSRGDILRKMQRHGEALESYDRALALDPGAINALINRCASLRRLQRQEEAVASYDRAMTIRPDLRAVLLVSRAGALMEMERFDDAIAACDDALGIDPDNADAHFARSLVRLLLGDFEGGLADYEWRPSKRRAGESPRLSCPQWCGEQPVAGRTILLHADQGLGDTIQFCRYAPLLAAREARVILAVQPPLRPLLAGLPGVDTILARGEAPPPADLHCPLLSLPLAFGTRLDTIPAQEAYLSADPAKIDRWSDILGPKMRPRVGVVWSGSARHVNDYNRSIPLALFSGLISADAEFVSLQKEVAEGDRDALAGTAGLRHLGDRLADFADSAALASLMDLVVSVDTAGAHLAAALGRPTWLLLPRVPDWRWLLDRDDSPWYPTLRLFRQPARGDWASVLERVKGELRAELARVSA